MELEPRNVLHKQHVSLVEQTYHIHMTHLSFYFLSLSFLEKKEKKSINESSRGSLWMCGWFPSLLDNEPRYRNINSDKVKFYSVRLQLLILTDVKQCFSLFFLCYELIVVIFLCVCVKGGERKGDFCSVFCFCQWQFFSIFQVIFLTERNGWNLHRSKYAVAIR